MTKLEELANKLKAQKGANGNRLSELAEKLKAEPKRVIRLSEQSGERVMYLDSRLGFTT